MLLDSQQGGGLFIVVSSKRDRSPSSEREESLLLAPSTPPPATETKKRIFDDDDDGESEDWSVIATEPEHKVYDDHHDMSAESIRGEIQEPGLKKSCIHHRQWWAHDDALFPAYHVSDNHGATPNIGPEESHRGSAEEAHDDLPFAMMPTFDHLSSNLSRNMSMTLSRNLWSSQLLSSKLSAEEEEEADFNIIIGSTTQSHTQSELSSLSREDREDIANAATATFLPTTPTPEDRKSVIVHQPPPTIIEDSIEDLQSRQPEDEESSNLPGSDSKDVDSPSGLSGEEVCVGSSPEGRVVG
ncbi:unnamed protein product [Calypogeia fissa]